MQLSCSIRYRENAIVNIALSAASTSDMERFYATTHSACWQKTALRVPQIGSRLAVEAAKRASTGLPSDRVVCAAALVDLSQIAHRRFGGVYRPALVVEPSHRVKAPFDPGLLTAIHAVGTTRCSAREIKGDR